MKVVALSNSMFQLLAKCSTASVLHALRKRDLKPNGALQVGSMFHAAVARYLKGDTPDACVAGFEEEYRNWTGAFDGWLFSDEHLFTKKVGRPQYALDNLKKILTEWFARHPGPQPFPVYIPPEWVEIGFELPLDEFDLHGEHYTLVITGQLDALGEEGDELYTVETKTAGRIVDWWKNKFEGDPQNTEYEWAAEQTTGREVAGTYINAIGTAKVPDSERTCYTHSYQSDFPGHEPENIGKRGKPLEHPTFRECSNLHVETEVFLVTRNRDLTEQWKKDAVYWAKRYVELHKFIGQGIVGATKTRTQGKFNDGCTFCEFRHWCIHSARNLQFADAMMGRDEVTMDTEGRPVRSGIYDADGFFAGGKK